MTQRWQEEHVFPYYRSPSAIRGQEFTHRVRGVDEAEVREFLGLLADQVQATNLERAETRAENERLRTENERLRAENERLRATPGDDATGDRAPQTVELFRQAQEVADALVEEAVRHAQRLLADARTEQQQILRQAQQVLDAAAREGRLQPSQHADVVPLRPPLVSDGQLRTVVEGLAEQVEELRRLMSLGAGRAAGTVPVGRLPLGAGPRP